MKKQHHPAAAAGIVFSGLCILLPLAVLAVWSISAQWAWPDILPQKLSFRALGELFGGYSGAMDALGLSVLLGLASAFCSTAVGTMTARAVVFYDFPGKRWISFAAMLPILLLGTALAMGLHVVFLRIGLADTFAGVMLAHIILSAPYTVKLMLDATEAIGRSYEEAALTLGANSLRAFFSVSLPALLPGIAASFVMSYILSFGDYFPTLLIGGGNVRTFTVMMVPYLQSGDRTMAAAYSVVYMLVTLAVFLIFDLAVKRKKLITDI